MSVYSTFDQIAGLLANSVPAELLPLKASPEMQARFEYLAEKSGENNLSPAEKDELDHYIVLERLIRIANIRARIRNSG